MKYDTLIFDLDGTLIDSLEDLMNSVNHALAKYGFPARSYDEIKSFVGNGVKNLVFRSTPEETAESINEQCLTAFKEHYLVHSMDKTAPYAGVPGMLEKVKKAGFKIAVVTNKMQPAAEKIIKGFFGDTFDVIIGQIDGLPVKPAPDGVWLAIEKLGSVREKSIYIGDSEVDCATAENSALPIVGVTWGFRGRKTLEDNHADYIVDTPEEIYDVLLRI